MLTHIDSNQMPTMVDVTDKKTTARVARAHSIIELPAEIRAYFLNQELILKKGPVFQTAIIAGTMAAKKTFEQIPFCHQIPIESCKFDIATRELANGKLAVTLTCTVKTTSKTGVEMEALHGATIAALTVYDMCKAISHDIVIKETKLLSKFGGKRSVFSKPLYGLVLTGGKSERMKQDKALLAYQGQPHALYLFDVLSQYCETVFISARQDQWNETALAATPTILDSVENAGPLSGILSAFKAYPDVNWFIVACDLAHFDAATAENLLSRFDESRPVTCYKNKEKGFPEPLCAVYTPLAAPIFQAAFKNDQRCPVKIISKLSDAVLIEQTDKVNLANINTPSEYAEALREIR